MRMRHFVLAVLAVCAAVPALAEDNGSEPNAATSTNSTQRADQQIESCLAEARREYPDTTAHGQRIMMAHQCICHQAANLCSGGMVQNDLLRQRILDDK